jgi:ppGpp synthetase/RelA/SpoT-type nucleotidyltranferase
MNFADYEKAGQARYAKMASTVASILEVIARDLPGVRVQQIQHRSKSPKSLKQKIEDRGGSLTDDVEMHAKDLAGCRIIFYTNDDLSAFIKSRVMWENFDIDWDRTKFHYPLDESSGEGLFISYNYVVKLKDQRTTLPEYAELEELWCEIQVQTTLDHAWSEMHHDTVYKPPQAGFGSAVLADVKARMSKIMQDHLLPAGFDFQKVSDDVRRLEKGRKFYDTQPLELILTDIDNNERYELVERYREAVLPYLDDVSEQAVSIRGALRLALAKTRDTPYAPVKLGAHEYPGKTLDDVIDACLDVVDALRFRDERSIEATWVFVGEAYDLTVTDEGQARVLRSVKSLTEHNMHIWKQVGPWVQTQVASMVANDVDNPSRRRIVIVASEAILNPEVTGTTSGSNTITFHQGAVRPSEDLATARATAITALERLLFSEGASDQKSVFDALLKATSFPYNSNYDAKLVQLVNEDTLKVVDIATRLAPTVDFYGRAGIERRMLSLYRQKGSSTDKDAENPGLVALGEELTRKLEGLRDALNEDRSYSIHKTLVGFESVSRQEWDRPQWDIEKSRSERTDAINAIVSELPEDSIGGLFPILLNIVLLQSNDGATFIPFYEFLQLLGRERPTIALQLLRNHEAEFAEFLSPILDGLSESTQADEANTLCREWIKDGRHLRHILAHCGSTRRFNGELFGAASHAVLVGDDVIATLSLVDLASRLVESQPDLIASTLLPAIRKVAAEGDFRWIDRTWFKWTADYVGHFTEAEIDELLSLATPISQLGSQEEWWLAAIAAVWPDKALRWIGNRIEQQKERDSGERYEAVPFSFHRLNEVLNAHGADVVKQARASFVPEDHSFRFSGGRLVEQVFPDVTPIEELLRPFATGSDEDRRFLSEILAAYDGSPSIDGLCRDLVAATEPDSETWVAVEMAIDSTGVVSGDFGMVEALLLKRAAVGAWLEDDRPLVRQFAEGHLLALDRQIAADRRRSMEELHLRKRQYGEA